MYARKRKEDDTLAQKKEEGWGRGGGRKGRGLEKLFFMESNGLKLPPFAAKSVKFL